MKASISMAALVLVLLAGLDAGVASGLHWAQERGRLGALVQYFDYGRSVPGKLARWEADPAAPGSLYDIAWRAGPTSALSGGAITNNQASSGITIRSYGMSFVDNILRYAQDYNPALTVDRHSGPGAPPNYTYALFLEDAPNRQPGDVAVLGVLSSSIPPMAAMSNRTWVFEQPAPFTYPVYYPNETGPGLRVVAPLVNSAADERALQQRPDARAAWKAQLAQEDLFYSPITFGATWLDVSPFARMVRRALAKAHVERSKTHVLDGAYPYAEALRRMILTFAETARDADQIPLVMLVQNEASARTDLLKITKSVLVQYDIPYFATAEHFDPSDLSGFLQDGHFRAHLDRKFGEVFADMVSTLATSDP